MDCKFPLTDQGHGKKLILIMLMIQGPIPSLRLTGTHLFEMSLWKQL
jgi:hypothetical protein